METKDRDRYEILRLLATGAVGGARLEESAHEALVRVCRLLELHASAVYLWNDQGQVKLSVAHAESEDFRRRLVGLEEDLFGALRRDRHLTSAYMSFGGDSPCHSFTLPLRHGGSVFGAVIGLQAGARTVVAEDAFLDAVSAAIALYAIAGGTAGTIPRELIDRERLAAILETAVTVNHEINNPLTAILGNVQLILLKRKDLDEELRTKLGVIEESASRIKDVTQRLLRLTSVRSVNYTDGTSMIDLSDDKDKGERSK